LRHCAGGPGSNKSALCQKAVRQAPGWVHFSVGRLLRATAETTDPRQGNDSHLVRQAISSGEMVPQVCCVTRVRTERKSRTPITKSIMTAIFRFYHDILEINAPCIQTAGTATKPEGLTFAVTPYTRIREELGSNPDPNAGYPY
jgi:hypothetical protein